MLGKYTADNISYMRIATLRGGIVPSVGQQHSEFHQSITIVLGPLQRCVRRDMCGSRIILGLLTGLDAALVDIGADGEDNRQQELQLLAAHGLEVDGIVCRLNAEPFALRS